MGILYPYNAPQILTDNIFVSYGGQTGTSTPAQRQASYLIAEQDVSMDIGSFLLPTIVTGVYPFQSSWIVSTEHSYINEVLGAWVVYADGCACQTNELSVCALIKDDTYGYVDLWPIHTRCGSCGCQELPFQFKLAYRAGLPTGTSMNNPNILLALTTVAQINLNEILQYGNEGVGDVGITQFRSMDYSEQRYGLKRTVYGASAKANFAHNKLKGFIRTKGLML